MGCMIVVLLEVGCERPYFDREATGSLVRPGPLPGAQAHLSPDIQANEGAYSSVLGRLRFWKRGLPRSYLFPQVKEASPIDQLFRG